MPAESRHLQPAPWGPKRVLFGGIILLSAYVLGSFVAILLIVLNEGSDARTDDVGDAFARANAVVEYADQRLKAASDGTALPEAPQLLANIDAIKIGLVITLVLSAVQLVIIGISSGLTFEKFVEAVGLNRFDVGILWRPVIAWMAAYIGILAYVIVVRQIGIDFFIPQSTVPGGVVRDDAALALAAVVAVLAAPFYEELLFRGFIFAGLLKWGFWPAAGISGLLFTLSHFDSGSIIPFFAIGVAMAFLFHRSGSIWQSIIFHALFNGTSMALLIASR